LSAAGVSSVRSRVANLKAYLPQFKDIHAFQAALQALLAGNDKELFLTEAQIAQIEADAAAKYRTWEWIYGHSPAAAFRVRRKFACGTVEAAFSIKGGCIDGLRFSGDFLGNETPERLEKAMQGCRFSPDQIREKLREAAVENCFDGVSAEELAGFLSKA
jgi:lipoate-protein ligase A